MPNIAQQTADACVNASVFTLYGAYATVSGRTVVLAQGVQELEKRNEKGQCSHARYLYADGSRLTYKRKANNGFSLTATPSPTV